MKDILYHSITKKTFDKSPIFGHDNFLYYKKGVFTVEKIVIKGGTPLHGEVSISGAKNAAVAIIPACLLINGLCRLENLPDIKDVKLFLQILSSMGASVKYINKNVVDIDVQK